MKSLKKLALIDLYYPTDETIAALLTVSPEQRETLLRRILSALPEAERDRHISRVLAMVDAFAAKGRSRQSDS